MLIVGILIILSLGLSLSYAHWQISKTQSEENIVQSACLNMEITEEEGSFSLENTFPIFDEEGVGLEGYTFQVTNNCDESVNYVVGIDSLSDTGDPEYLNYDNIKVQIDDQEPKVYSELENIQRDGVRDSKIIGNFTLKEKFNSNLATRKHTIRVWLSSEADMSEQNKTFIGKAFVIGGQGIKGDLIASSDRLAPENIKYYYYSSGLLEIVGTGAVNMSCDTSNSNLVEDILNLVSQKLDLTAVERNILTQKKHYLYPIIGGDYRNFIYTFYSSFFSFSVIDKIDNFDSYINFLELYQHILGIQLNADFFLLANKIHENFPSITKILIGEGITDLGTSCFSYIGAKPSNLILPGTLTILRSNFANTTNIYYDLSRCNSLTQISYYAFLNSPLKKITIPNSVSKIEAQAFQNSAVEEVILPTNPNYTKIEVSTFQNCQNLKKVIIPENVTYINGSAFADITDLSKVTLYFIGPQRTITGITLTAYNVVWNYLG